MRAPALLIFGPTAIGKSDLALEVASRVGGEIISVDSAQVYRDMDIGTAKPPPEVRTEIPHHLIDLLDPRESFSAGAFQERAIELAEQIYKRGRLPIFVGGTMLYFHALLYGLSPLPKGDPVLRKRIDLEAERLGWPELHKRLAEIDPKVASRIHPQDRQRIQRALEIYCLTSKPPSLFHHQKSKPPPFKTVQIALVPEDREKLYQRIARRFRKMIALGFVEEVVRLFRRDDLHADLPSTRSVGYRQVWGYLEGQCSFAEMVEGGIRATRQLAKRQLTWLRQFPDAHRFAVSAISPQLITAVVARGMLDGAC